MSRPLGSALAMTLTTAAILAVPQTSHAAWSYKGQSTTQITRLYLNAVSSTTIRARGPSGVDPVLHVLGTDNVQRYENDDYAPPDRTSRLTVPPGQYWVVVHSYSDDARGTGTLEYSYDGGTSWVIASSTIPIGGTVREVPFSILGTEYRTVANWKLGPAGPFDTVMFPMSGVHPPNDIIRGYFDDTGIPPSERAYYPPGSSPIGAILVGSYYSQVGTFDLVANDIDTDTDRDGLGDALEAALGTCSSKTDAGTGLCSYVFSPKDSDRDGIPDAEEVFGVLDPVDGKHQYLPAWGADPRAKDVFIEVDYAYTVPNCGPWPRHCDDGSVCTVDANCLGVGGRCNDPTFPPFTEAMAVSTASPYSAALDSEMLTPGRGSLRVHMDIGRDCADVTRCGNWGGGGTQLLEDDGTERWYPIRYGRFRYMVNTPCGGSARPGYKVNCGLDDPTTCAHELGHSLGLTHSGADKWDTRGGSSETMPTINCKPHYVSLMNYGTPVNQFSHGVNRSSVLNPARVNEPTAVMFDANPMNVTSGGTPGLWHTTYSGGADFNRSGSIDQYAGNVRTTGLTAAWTGMGCGSAMVLNTDVQIENTTAVGPSVLPGVSPGLVRLGSRLFGVWADTKRSIKFSWTDIGGPDASGGCLNDGAVWPAQTSCENWLWNPKWPVVSTSVDIVGLSATLWGDLVVVAYSTSANDVFVTTMDSSLVWSAPRLVATSIANQSDITVAPVIVSPTEFGVPVSVGVFFVRGATHTAVFSSDLVNWTTRPLLDEGGNLIPARLAPAIASVPNVYTKGISFPPAGFYTCGAFPETDGVLTFRCYNATTNRWSRIPGAFDAVSWGDVPKTIFKPSLAYHTLRRGAQSTQGARDFAAPLDSDLSAGQFFLVWFPGPYPSLAVSSRVGIGAPPSNATKWRVIDVLTDGWSPTHGAAGFALFEDNDMSSMRALGFVKYVNTTQNTASIRLRSLPTADGAFNVDLRDGNDFHVMEANICRGVRMSLGDAYSKCDKLSPLGY